MIRLKASRLCCRDRIFLPKFGAGFYDRSLFFFFLKFQVNLSWTSLYFQLQTYIFYCFGLLIPILTVRQFFFSLRIFLSEFGAGFYDKSSNWILWQIVRKTCVSRHHGSPN